MNLLRTLKLFLIILIPCSLLIYFSVLSTTDMIEWGLSVPNTVIYTLVLVLLVFLLILIIRFLFLLLFSFLDTMESLHASYKKYSPMVSILVPAYNEGKVIEKSIRALLNLDYPQYEIIVINDGSTDDTLKKLLPFEGKHGNANLIVVNKRNSGKAHSLNRGLAIANGDLIVSVDADSKLSSLTLSKLVRHFIDPTVGAVAGNIKVINRNNFWTRLQALEYIEGLNLGRRAQGFLRIVNIIPGPLGMFRKRVIKEVGGYSNDTFAEDCDLTLKIISLNWKIKYEGSAVSRTEAPESLIDIFKQRYRWTRGIIQSIKKHRKRIFFPFRNFSSSFTLWMMIFESIIWPPMNILSNLFMVYVSIRYGFTPIMVYWWCLLTLLDIAMALYCISIEDEQFSLVAYSFFYRIFYIFAVDVCKFFACIEELFNVKMSWGKVERKGRL